MPDFIHRPVMLAEVPEWLDPKPGGRYADGTLGGAGHAAAILKASAPTGWVYGCDRDGAAVEAATQRLAEFAGRFEVRRGNFAELADWIAPGSCDGVLLDLGVSSPQLDEAGRGFSFQTDGPLDMRMDQRQAVTAADLVNTAAEADLSRWFWELGDERSSRRFARELVGERARRPFRTTRQLAEFIERLSPRAGQRIHPATRVFQALRLAVNDELGSLQRGLQAAWQILRPAGRLVVISFHSLEARAMKDFGRGLARDYVVPGEVDVPELRQARPPLARWLTRKPLEPRADEVAENPRARSAQMRVLEKL